MCKVFSSQSTDKHLILTVFYGQIYQHIKRSNGQNNYKKYSLENS